ncbi:MAG: Holliday junction branch migration protein RuvA [Desulfovibrionaceae bacterium]
MIALIQGTLMEAGEKSCIVLTSGGVGYEVRAAAPTLAGLPKVGEETALFTMTVVREDALDLYGFLTSEERRLFGVLLSIPKLGPKKALSVLAAFGPDALRDIAAREDVAGLATVPGIGKKSAQQILFDLKFKLKDEIFAPGTPKPGSAPHGSAGSEFRDALAGLAGLGYADEEVRPLLAEVFEDEPEIDAASAIRLCLKKIAASRA